MKYSNCKILVNFYKVKISVILRKIRIDWNVVIQSSSHLGSTMLHNLVRNLCSKPLGCIGLHPDGARWLVDNRKIFGIGIDTLSIDSGRSSADLRAHRILAPHNIFNLENLNTKPLESRSEQFKNPFLVVSPLKISGGSGSPVRPFIIDTPNYLINDVRRTTSPLSYILLLLLNFVTFLSMGL